MDLSEAVTVCSAPENHAAERDSRLKPRQSLTSGKVTHHISFRLSISGDAASFCVFSPSEAEGAAKPLFSPSVLVFKRKLRQECLRLLPQERNRSSDSTRSPAGSKPAQNDTNQSISKSLEGGIFAILEKL